MLSRARPPRPPWCRDVELIAATAARRRRYRELLVFSGKEILSLQVLDLNAVIAGLTLMLRRLIGEDVDVVTELAPGWAVRADSDQPASDHEPRRQRAGRHAARWLHLLRTGQRRRSVLLTVTDTEVG